MLAFFRSMAKSKLVWIVLFVPMVAGLMTIGNVRSGLQGLFQPKDTVISAGSRVFSSGDFKREFEAFRKQSQQEGQPVVTPESAVAAGLDRRMLQQLADRESIAEELKRIGVEPADQLVSDQIGRIKAFFDPVSGKFDKRIYLQVLRQNDIDPDQFLQGLRDEISYNQLASGMAAGLKPPRLYGALFGAYLFEQHNLSVFTLSPAVLGPPPQPTDADLKKIMDDNAKALTVPETRVLTVVKFSAAALAPTVTPDAAEVKKRFDFRKDSLDTPEKRSLLQISVKDAGQAAAVAAKLKAGVDPAEAAKSVGAPPPLAYTDSPKAGVADSKVGQAAFALADGAVSGPIQGALGWAVVKITKVTPGKTVTFEEVRPQIEQEVKTEAAADKAYDQVQKYEDAHGKGATLVEAAKAAGATAVTMAPVTAGGQDADAKPMGDLSQRLLKEAFSLPQGGDTDAIQDGKGEYFAVRVEKIIPPALPPFEKLKPRLAQAFMQREIGKRLDAKLTELAARVKKGETLEAVARSVGSEVTHIALTRSQAQQSRNLSPQQAQQIFAAKPGDVITAGAVVAHIDSVSAPSAGVIASVMSSAQGSLARPIYEELQEEGRAWARAQVKPKINLALARQAIGVTSDSSAPGPDGSPASPAK